MEQITTSAARQGAVSAGPRSLLATTALGSVAGERVGLGPTEFRRRLMHISPGFLPFLLWAIPHQDPWGPILANVVIGISAALVTAALTREGRKPHPRRVSSSPWVYAPTAKKPA